MRIEKEKHKNPKSETTEPMLFSPNALASGPQACFFVENAIAKAGKFFEVTDWIMGERAQ